MSSQRKTFLTSRLHVAFFVIVLLTHHPHHGGHQRSSSVWLAQAAPKHRKDGNPLSRSVSVNNKAAAKIDIFWIHPHTQALAPSNTNDEGIVFGASTGVLSYIGHQFEVQEIPHPKTGKCKYANCRKAYFTCSEQENQDIDIETDPENPTGNFIVKIDDDKLKAEREALRALEPCSASVADIVDPQQKLAALAECWKTQADIKLAATQNEIAFQKVVRKKLGAKLQEYKCDTAFSDAVNLTTSHSLLNETYFEPSSEKQVELLFESDFSSVRLYRDFLTTKECQTIMIGQTVAASDTAVQKIRRLVSDTLLRDPYTAGTKSIRVRVDGAADNEHQQECTVQADGSCLPNNDNKTASSSSSLMRVTQTDESVEARLLVTCTKGAQVKGGALFYPKAGIQVVPVSGEAVFTIYRDFRGRRDDDPFVDYHIVCPVQSGVVLTLEDTYYSAAQ